MSSKIIFPTDFQIFKNSVSVVRFDFYVFTYFLPPLRIKRELERRMNLFALGFVLT